MTIRLRVLAVLTLFTAAVIAGESTFEQDLARLSTGELPQILNQSL